MRGVRSSVRAGGVPYPAEIRAGALGLLLFGASVLAAPPCVPPSAEAAESNGVTYEFETTLAPVCIAGSFPLSIEAEGGAVVGTLDAHTDDRGVVTGTLSFGAKVLAARGQVKYRSSRSTLRLTAWGPEDRVVIKARLEAGAFAGVSRGQGTLAPGKNLATLDLRDAPPSTAVIRVVFPPESTPALRGWGTAQVVTTPLNVDATWREGRALSLSLRGGAFRWKGKGSAGEEPGTATFRWTSKGWGAVASGGGLTLAPLPPP